MSKYVVQAGWKDAPHLSPQVCDELLASIPFHQREARMNGTPSLGDGKIYQVPEDDFRIAPFRIPPHFKQAYGLDVGLRCTAAVFGALDTDSDILYIHSLHYGKEDIPSIHADAIKGRGKWIKGVIDPAARGRNPVDGQRLIEVYEDLGLSIEPADNAVSAGIYAVTQRLVSGRLKVFETLSEWFAEYRLYRRKDGKIVKEKDHAMDACLSGDTLIITSEGLVPIGKLGNKSGLVLSRDGSWAHFCGARKTIENALIVRVSFEDGFTVNCTYDHPFLTRTGWVWAIDLAGKDVHDGVSQCVHRSEFFSRKVGALHSFYLRLGKSLKGALTTFAANTFSATASSCIPAFGNPPTSAASPRASTFTTRTNAEPITGRTISASKKRAHTLPAITRGESTTCLSKLSAQLANGMDRLKVSSGTSGITNNSAPRSMRPDSSDANTAPSLLALSSTASIASARTTARPNLARRLVWTTRNVLAWFAAAAFWRIATSRNPHARANAVVRCVSVQEAGLSDVYCLTVPGSHSFCLANGAVTHNTRYLEMSGLDVATCAPAPPPDVYRRHGSSKFTG